MNMRLLGAISVLSIAMALAGCWKAPSNRDRFYTWYAGFSEDRIPLIYPVELYLRYGDAHDDSSTISRLLLRERQKGYSVAELNSRTAVALQLDLSFGHAEQGPTPIRQLASSGECVFLKYVDDPIGPCIMLLRQEQEENSVTTAAIAGRFPGAKREVIEGVEIIYEIEEDEQVALWEVLEIAEAPEFHGLEYWTDLYRPRGNRDQSASNWVPLPWFPEPYASGERSID